MANLVAVLATTYHPFFYRASTAPPESKPDFADEWVRKAMAYREALATRDYVKLFELGAHHFLTLTLFIALFERDYAEPLGFQREYAQKLQHWPLPYPDTTT